MSATPWSDTDNTTAPLLALTRPKNPPGKSRLSYRIGAYETFYRAMLDLLTTQTVSAGDHPPLAALTTRALDDPAIALLDSWAIVGDVITFYQECIANEGYLRTAVENRSVLEMARALGYELSPGVAASVLLAFTVSTTPGSPSVLTIPKGTRVQSVPGQNQLPQTFETMAPVEARAAWNVLKPRVTQPQSLSVALQALDLAGTNTQLQPGHPLLFVDAARPKVEPELRLVQTVTPDLERNTTRVTWSKDEPLQQSWGALSSVLTFRQRLPLFGYNAPDWNNVPDAVKVGSQGPSPINCLAVVPDGQVMVSGHADGNIWLWMVNKGQGGTSSIPLLPKGHQGAVNSVALSPNFANDRHILSGGADGTLQLWTVSADFKQVAGPPVILTGHQGTVASVAFSPTYATDRQFLSGSADQTLRLWTLAADHAAVQSSTSLPGQGPITSVAFAPNYSTSRQVLSGSTDQTLRLWTLTADYAAVQSWMPLPGHTGPVPGHTGPVTSVAFSPAYGTDHQLLSGSADQTLRLWTLAADHAAVQSSTPLTGHTGSVASVAFSPTYATDRQLLSGSADQTLRLWTLAADHPAVQSSTPLAGHFFGVNAVVYVPKVTNNGVSASNDTTVKLWDLTAKKLLQAWLPDATQGEWPDFGLNSDRLDLSSEDTSLVKGDQILVFDQSGSTPAWQLCTIQQVASVARHQYTLTAKVTSLSLAPALNPQQFHRRTTVVFAHSQPLALAEAALGFTLPSGTCQLQLDRAVLGLQVGQRLALRGEIARDGQTGSGAWSNEIVVLKEVASSDASPTLLTFTKPLTQMYVRSTVTLNANIAEATHGATILDEVLGSGDGTRTNQRFTLQQKPLTYVSAPTATGNQSTLTVRVNQVAWQEVPSLYGLHANSRGYMVRQDEHGQVHLIFGDGRQGLRLPSGQENVVATYRVGTGLEGEVEAGSLTLMQNKPLGVESVTNPLKAAGAAPPDTIETARRKAPLAVATLERLVSLQDFAAFAMTFAGIGKVQVARLWDSHTRVIHLTVLGADQQAVLPSSELYCSLQRGIAARAAPQQTVLVQSGQDLIQRFNVEARVLVEPGYQVAPIRESIRTVLQRTFAFDQRTFGQSVAASDVITLMQQVRGVRAVELTALYDASETATLQLLLRATLARWDSLNKVFEPAQLLVINNDGITLTLENVDE